MTVTVWLADGIEGKYDRVFVKSSGWVMCQYENGDNYEYVHYPPHKVDRIESKRSDDVKYQSPHGRV